MSSRHGKVMSAGFSNRTVSHIEAMREKIILKGKSMGKTTIGDHEIDHGNDVAHILGGANLEAARAEYELSAKRSAFFFAIQQGAQQWAIQGANMPRVYFGALFRTVSENAILAAWGWQLQTADFGER